MEIDVRTTILPEPSMPKFSSRPDPSLPPPTYIFMQNYGVKKIELQ